MYAAYIRANDFKLILMVKMETIHPLEGYILVVSFRRSVIIAELWRPEVARPGNVLRNFCVFFWKNDPFTVKFSVSKVFIATPIDVIVFKFREIWPTGNRQNRALFIRQKTSPVSQTVASARMVPKICQGQPPTMYSECSRFHPNWFTFGGVITERVNTAKLPRKVNPIFGRNI